LPPGLSFLPLNGILSGWFLSVTLGVAGGGAADHGCANFPQLTFAKSARPPDLWRFFGLADPPFRRPPWALSSTLGTQSGEGHNQHFALDFRDCDAGVGELAAGFEERRTRMGGR